MEANTKKKDFNLYKFLSSFAIIGLFLAVGVIVLIVTGMFSFNKPVLTISLVLGIICFGCELALGWAKQFEENKNKVLSIVFLSMIGVCVILWIIAAILIVNTNYDAEMAPVGMLIYLKIAFIISIQFITANIIASCILRYKKTMIPFQVITYISNLFVDFYVTGFILCLTVTNKGLELNTNIAKFLFTKTMLSLFVLFLVYVIISYCIVRGVGKNTTKRRIRRYSPFTGVEEVIEERVNDRFEPEEENDVKEVVDYKKKLEDLKSMLDSGIITQEEYDQKKAEILKEM